MKNRYKLIDPLNLRFFDKDFYKPIDKKFETPESQKYYYDRRREIIYKRTAKRK